MGTASKFDIGNEGRVIFLLFIRGCRIAGDSPPNALTDLFLSRATFLICVSSCSDEEVSPPVAHSPEAACNSLNFGITKIVQLPFLKTQLTQPVRFFFAYVAFTSVAYQLFAFSAFPARVKNKA